MCMETRAQYDLERLLFRRQFILGPQFVERFPLWKRLTVRKSICITVHPDLQTCVVEDDNKSITLLGYILDPKNPQYEDYDILRCLIGELTSTDDLDSFFSRTDSLGGRWILIIDSGQEIRLFNDAAGYRQVYFTDITMCQELWCGSQPGIIAEILELCVDAQARTFMNSISYTSNKEYTWPGDSSPYKEIRHLVPNHFLRLDTGSCHRYWPTTNLGELSLQQCVAENAALLVGLMQSAFNRFELALSITAGRDTRLILAAAKEIRRQVFFFTMMHSNMTANSADIRIPSNVLANLGLPHNVINCQYLMEERFSSIYKHNVTEAHEFYGTIAQGLYYDYPADKVCVKGNAIPIAKCHYHYSPHLAMRGERTIDANTLANLIGAGDSVFAVKACDEWLLGAKETYNVDILDLYEWEIREGNWQAMSQLEWDIVQEVFVPFNCRTFLVNMLSVRRERRGPPRYELHEALIRGLWPEVLEEPINPHPTGNSKGMSNRAMWVRETLTKSGLYGWVPARIRRLGRFL